MFGKQNIFASTKRIYDKLVGSLVPFTTSQTSPAQSGQVNCADSRGGAIQGRHCRPQQMCTLAVLLPWRGLMRFDAHWLPPSGAGRPLNGCGLSRWTRPWTQRNLAGGAMHRLLRGAWCYMNMYGPPDRPDTCRHRHSLGTVRDRYDSPVKRGYAHARGLVARVRAVAVRPSTRDPTGSL